MYRYLIILSGMMLISPTLAAQDNFDFDFKPTTTIGGYGELHYNFKQAEGEPSSKVLDFHRFVLFVSHAWTEKWSFRSEIELEHNVVGDNKGDLQLEQAYLEYHYAQSFGFQIGVILASAGLINEYHEPTTFLSVERPEYARLIIPTTWFGNGVNIYGLIGGFDYRFAIMEGLDGSGFSETSGIREGRQKGFKSNAGEFLYNARLDYLHIPGLRAGISYSYNNAIVNDSTRNAIRLFELHAKYFANRIYAVIEYGNITYGSGNLQASRGYYMDLGYDIGHLIGNNWSGIPFIRWADYNTAAETVAGGDRNKANHFRKWMVGFALKPIPNVVIKMDYGIEQNQLSRSETTHFNLGTGYLF